MNIMLKGDTKPLEVLYKRHYELLLNFGLKYVSDEEFVKDCIQIFVKLCSSTRLSPTDYVRSYLLTSLKNLIFDKLSSLKSTEDINALPFDLTIEDTSLEVLFKDNDEDIQMIKNLQEAYKQLSENQRMAIYLRYIKGLSYREVAAVLEINPQSAMNLVSRTLTSLRSKMTLKEYLFFPSFFSFLNATISFVRFTQFAEEIFFLQNNERKVSRLFLFSRFKYKSKKWKARKQIYIR